MKSLAGRGVTLIEAIVVIGILGMLLSILLPAIQSARESARQLYCGNNLRQLGVASHSFHEAQRRFPPGFLGQVPLGGMPDFRNQNLGLLTYLLPYLDLQFVYDEIDIETDERKSPPTPKGATLRVPWWSRRAEGTWHIAQAKIAQFRCPSTNADDFIEGVAGLMRTTADPPGNPPTSYLWMFRNRDKAQHLGKTNYLGTAGFAGEAAGWESFRGVFTNRSRTTFRDVRDGLSNTTLLGEHAGGFECDEGGGRITSFPWIGIGAAATSGGLTPAPGCVRAHWSQFSSEHHGIVQFVFADGSVRRLATRIDRRGFVLLSSMADVEVVDAMTSQ